MCSGKVYFDLLEAREKLKKDDVILFRIEQLYPFPAKTLVKELKPYAKNAKFFWCQEEPKNIYFHCYVLNQNTLQAYKGKSLIKSVVPFRVIKVSKCLEDIIFSVIFHSFRRATS